MAITRAVDTLNNPAVITLYGFFSQSPRERAVELLRGILLQRPELTLFSVEGRVICDNEILPSSSTLGDTLFPIVSLSVALILFEGGLDLPPRELRNTGTAVRRLITIGAAISIASTARRE